MQIEPIVAEHPEAGRLVALLDGEGVAELAGLGDVVRAVLCLHRTVGAGDVEHAAVHHAGHEIADGGRRLGQGAPRECS